MKKAYIIIAHKNAHQLNRLVFRLTDGNSEFYIHIDKKVDINQFSDLLPPTEVVHYLERFDSKWGSYGTIKPYLSALKEIKQLGKQFDRIMLLSGQDYPIKSNQKIDEFFKTSQHSVFIDHFPIPNYEKWPGRDRGGLYRVDKYYFGSKWHELFCSRSLNLLANYVPFLKRKMPDGLRPFAGQTWWNLDMYALSYILAYHQAHPEGLEFLKNTFVADELFVQMIIGNSTDDKLLASIGNADKRFTIWESPESAHPKILGVGDFKAINESTDLFARKFDETIDSEILDLIDERILLAHHMNYSYSSNDQDTIVHRNTLVIDDRRNVEPRSRIQNRSFGN